jgi:hypothetical protein
MRVFHKVRSAPKYERIGPIWGRWIGGPGRPDLTGYPVAIARLCCQSFRRL